MERGMTNSALLAAAPLGTWSAARGYSSKPQKGTFKREGQIHPILETVQPRSRSRLISRGTQNNSMPASASGKRASSRGRGSEPLQQTLDAGYRNLGVFDKSLGHPSLPGGRRAGTPAASKKISDWMARSTRAEEFQAGHGSSRPAEDDVYSQRSGFSGYSYSSGTSLQSYSGVWQ